MKVNMKIKYIGPIRNIVKKSEELLTIEQGYPIREVIAILIDRHKDDLRPELFTLDGGLRPEIQMLLNGKNIETMEGLDTKLLRGGRLQVLHTMLVVSGG